MHMICIDKYTNYVCIRVYVYEKFMFCVYAYMHRYIHTFCVCMCVSHNVYVCMHKETMFGMYAYIHVYIYIHIYIYIYIHVCVSVHIHIHKHLKPPTLMFLLIVIPTYPIMHTHAHDSHLLITVVSLSRTSGLRRAPASGIRSSARSTRLRWPGTGTRSRVPSAASGISAGRPPGMYALLWGVCMSDYEVYVCLNMSCMYVLI
jgi:hypothetical protein